MGSIYTCSCYGVYCSAIIHMAWLVSYSEDHVKSPILQVQSGKKYCKLNAICSLIQFTSQIAPGSHLSCTNIAGKRNKTYFEWKEYMLCNINSLNFLPKNYKPTTITILLIPAIHSWKDLLSCYSGPNFLICIDLAGYNPLVSNPNV